MIIKKEDLKVAMKLILKRIALRDTYTIGKLYIDGVYFCDTLEDKVRDLNKNGKFDNGEKKVYSETAIPYGIYKVDINTVSPRFKNRVWAKPYGGKIPRLLNVNSFEGVLIHPGTTSKDTSGCLLVGRNTIVGKLTQSQNTFHKLMSKLKGQKDITIEIV